MAQAKPSPKDCYGPRLDEALVFAAEGFRQITRKGGVRAPYLTHLLAVAALVGDHGGSEDQIIAALLHDTLEDLDSVTARDLERRFGPEVTRMVEALSDTTVRPKPPWRTRKETYLARLALETAQVKLVSAADKIHNLTSLLRSLGQEGPAIWREFNAAPPEQVWYYRAVVTALATGWDHAILEELRSLVETFAAEVETPSQPGRNLPFQPGGAH